MLTSACTSLLNAISTSTPSARSATDMVVITGCELCDPGAAASWEIARAAVRPAKRNRIDAIESMRICFLLALTLNGMRPPFCGYVISIERGMDPELP